MRNRVKDARLIRTRLRRYAMVTIRRMGFDTIVCRIRRPGKRKGYRTTFRDLLRKKDWYHPRKRPLEIFANDQEVQLSDTVQPGSEVVLVAPVRGSM